MSESDVSTGRSYGCSRACGNPYDFIVIAVSEAHTEMLCLPCFVQTAMEMVRAVVSPDDETVQSALTEFPPSDQVPMAGGVKRTRGHHAPAESDDPDMLQVFDGVITEDELPDAFR